MIKSTATEIKKKPVDKFPKLMVGTGIYNNIYLVTEQNGRHFTGTRVYSIPGGSKIGEHSSEFVELVDYDGKVTLENEE